MKTNPKSPIIQYKNGIVNWQAVQEEGMAMYTRVVRRRHDGEEQDGVAVLDDVRERPDDGGRGDGGVSHQGEGCWSQILSESMSGANLLAGGGGEAVEYRSHRREGRRGKILLDRTVIGADLVIEEVIGTHIIGNKAIMGGSYERAYQSGVADLAGEEAVKSGSR
uniref:Uncharacterized protein n=1 Tax=Oryza glumipatula TaxID=40148 RepID=A0A0E0AVC1_9ORYZ